LNRDYRRYNSDSNNTLAEFQPVAGDARIQFILAETDPNGQPTTGVTRTQTTVTEFNGDTSASNFDNACQLAANGGIDAWDRTRYMNIWVCVLSSSTLGYAQLPGGPASTDGIVIDTGFFGLTSTPPYNLGRTLTHEVGHWFNLQHTWGSGSGSCLQDDGVTDTPNTDQPHYACPLNTISCSVRAMVQNYMDYTDDSCMNLFTLGQIARMRAELTSGGRRTALPIVYNGVIPGISDNYTDTTSSATSSTGSITGGDASSEPLIDLPFQIPGVGFWGTIAIIIVAGVLVLVLLAGCVGCLCCAGGRD